MAGFAVLQSGETLPITANDKAGLRFKGAAEAEASEASERRKRPSERVTLSAEVTMRPLGRAKYQVRIHDLSLEGCRVELAERPERGERVLVNFAGLNVLEASVCWIKGQLAGLSFDRPIHPAGFDLMIARLAA